VSADNKKGGDARPLFSRQPDAYRFFPAFFTAFFAVFFAISQSPPSCVDCVSWRSWSRVALVPDCVPCALRFVAHFRAAAEDSHLT